MKSCHSCGIGSGWIQMKEILTHLKFLRFSQLVTRSIDLTIPNLSRSAYANAAYRRRSRSWRKTKYLDNHLYGKLQAPGARSTSSSQLYLSRHTRYVSIRHNLAPVSARLAKVVARDPLTGIHHGSWACTREMLMENSFYSLHGFLVRD